jgi:hypothetical protein
MPSSFRNRVGRLIGLLVVLAASAGAQCGAKNDCPALQIRQVYLSGRAPQVIVKNRSDRPIDHVVFRVAYQDLFPKYHELTVESDSVIQPGQRSTIALEPIGSSVDWETLNVSASCEAAAVDPH